MPRLAQRLEVVDSQHDSKSYASPLGTVPSSERSCSSHLTPEVLRYGPKAYNSGVLSRSVQLERSCG